MKHEYKISICMMVKNEEKNMVRCLEHLKPLIKNDLAELIIVDTGSKDHTVTIAKDYTNKLYIHPWDNNFSEMRNKSISYARGEWIFIIDADERLNDAEELIEIISSSNIKEFNTIQFNIKNLRDINDENNYNLNISPRLFKNDGSFRYEGIVHNQPIYKGPVLSTGISITHFGYVGSDKELMDIKFNRTTELIKKELQINPNNIYYIYQLGISYEMHRDYALAFEEFNRAYLLISKKNTKEKKKYINIMGAYANSAYLNSRLDEAAKAAKETINIDNEYIDMYYIAGYAEKLIGNFEKANSYFKKYINFIDRYQELDISRNNSIALLYVNKNSVSNAYFEMCQIHYNQNKYEDAYNDFLRISDMNQRIHCSINLLLELKKYQELFGFYSVLSDEESIDKFLLTLEDKLQRIKDAERSEIYMQFSADNGIYGRLCEQRLNVNCQDLESTKLIINKIDFNKEAIFYSEFLIGLKDELGTLFHCLSNVETIKLRNIFYSLIKKDNEILTDFHNYINQLEGKLMELRELRVALSLMNTILLISLEDTSSMRNNYNNIFKNYIKYGIDFVSKIYQLDQAEFISKNVSTKEDRFFLTMYLVNCAASHGDKASTIKHLRSALAICEEYVKYIDIYKDELLKDERQEAENTELEKHKRSIKGAIIDLIENDELEQALSVVAEYEKMIPNDLEILLFKSEIAIRED